jgi:methyl-accepting chemotaxis protein
MVMKNQSLRFRLFLNFFIAALNILVVGGIGVWGQVGTIQKYKNVTESSQPKLEHLMSMRTIAYRLEAMPDALDNGLLSNEERLALMKEVIQFNKDFLELETKYESFQLTESESQHYLKIKDSYKELYQSILKLAELANINTKESLEEYHQVQKNRFLPAAKNFDQFVDAAAVEEKKLMHDTADTANAFSRWINILSVVFVIAGFSFQMGSGFLFTRHITTRLQNITESLGKNSNFIAQTSKDIRESSQQLASASTTQAEALQETVASVHEISSMVSKNTENSQRSVVSSKENEQTAAQGKETVESMMGSMENINQSNERFIQQVDESNVRMQEIVQVIQEIEQKTKVINDIVFQTKLLSFNASVEAARAGEHGKGFSVVAEEVGNLATMSGQASKEISSLLQMSLDKVQSIARDTQNQIQKLAEQGKETVKEGVERAQQTNASLDNIYNNVQEVNQLVTEISFASEEQSKGIEEVKNAMLKLDEMTQQNASVAKKSAQASEDLDREFTDMELLMKDLHHLIYGQKGASNTKSEKSATAVPPKLSKKATTASTKEKAENILPMKKVTSSAKTSSATKKISVVQKPEVKTSEGGFFKSLFKRKKNSVKSKDEVSNQSKETKSSSQMNFPLKHEEKSTAPIVMETKVAAGQDYVPSADDSRFEDV